MNIDVCLGEVCVMKNLPVTLVEDVASFRSSLGREKDRRRKRAEDSLVSS